MFRTEVIAAQRSDIFIQTLFTNDDFDHKTSKDLKCALLDDVNIATRDNASEYFRHVI